jgi:phosphatidylinositol alpha-mannosyltransferase
VRVLLTTPYDLSVPGGVNRQAVDLLGALERRGVDALLLGPASGPIPGNNPHITALGRVWTGSFNGARSRVTLDPTIAGRVRRIVGDFGPDVVHLQEPFLPLLNSLVLLFAGRARRVGTFHTYSESSRGYLWAWPWCRWTNTHLDVRIAVSPAAMDYARAYHPADYTILPNGVRTPPPGMVRPAGPPRRPMRVLFVGRADEPRKGFGILAEAMGILEREEPGAFLLSAAGPGTGRGSVGDAALGEAFASSDVCVVPSLRGESFGLVALEALAHGLPVVATAIRGHADWLNGAGAGALVPPGDAAAIAAALRTLASDPERYQACAARALEVAREYEWDALAGRILDLYGRP